MAYQDEILADNPVLYLRLDETAGTTAADLSGGGHDGTISGSPTLGAAGLITDGTSIVFDGVNDDIVVADHADLRASTTMTIEAWVQRANLADNLSIVWKRGTKITDGVTAAGYQAWVRGSDGKLAFTYFGISDYPSTTAIINDTDPHHVAFVLGGGSVTFFIDGVQYDSVAIGTPNLTNQALHIGARTDLNGVIDGYFPGTRDEVAIYQTALSATRITAHYDAGVAGGGGTPINLSGTDGGQATSSAAVLREMLMEAAAQGSGTAEAALRALRNLEAAALGSGSAQAALEVARALSAAGTGLSSVEVDARRQVLLDAVGAGQGSAEGDLVTDTAILLAGTATGLTQAEAQLTIQRILAGQADGTGEAEATAFIERLLAGTGAGQASASGTLHMGVPARIMRVEVLPFYEIAAEVLPYYNITAEVLEAVES